MKPTRDAHIAIVGMAGMFPGASSLEEFWTNLLARKDAAREVPAGRWHIAANGLKAGTLGQVDRVASLRGCFLDQFAFDAEGLDVDPEFVSQLDPLVHIVLHVGRAAFRDAVMTGVNLDRVGVALANIALPTESVSKLSREVLLPALLEGKSPTVPEELAAARYVTGLPAGLLAKGLGLGAGTFTLDAACASSLYSLDVACRELRAGRADAMLAGGVSRPDSLYTQMGFTALYALSPTGRCSPFDSRGDGLLVGEGAGIFVLKRLDDAIHAGDHIYGVIRGIGLSNDVGGKLLAPDTEGQLRAMRAAYIEAGWKPTDVDLIECHGTGTPVGDAVELSSLKSLWRDGEWTPGQCVIGSVKASIGHLLTGAGAAGLMKTLLALKNKTLPPQANFERPGSGLQFTDSPFHVATQAVTWNRRDDLTPRRAAVSAFGFGGINAHVLVEEWNPVIGIPARKADQAGGAAVAIVGMEARFGRLESMRAFQEAVLAGTTAVGARPKDRWRSVKVAPELFPGAYLRPLAVEPGEFRIPPNEISQLLPQQLLMLQVAKAALSDAGLVAKGRRETRVRAGVVVGMSLDLNTTNFDLRWTLGAGDSRRDDVAPALNATRTLGALGGMIASRIARELDFGGPSFTLSSEESSGLRAVEVAVRNLQDHRLDLVVAGAVDVAGDPRTVLATDQLSRYSQTAARPFDVSATGAVPGEGAAAVVLKRLEDAQRDGDRIYAVIRGIGASSAGGYAHALELAYEDAAVSRASVSYIEANASGNAELDAVEAQALVDFRAGDAVTGTNVGDANVQRRGGFSGSTCALGSAKAVIGDAGAAAGLAGLVKTSLCLFHEVLPPLPGFVHPRAELAGAHSPFHIPQRPLPWLRDRANGPRRAGVSAMGADGSCLHAVLEGVEHAAGAHGVERTQPLGARSEALFTVTAQNAAGLSAALAELEAYARTNDSVGIEALARSWVGLGHTAVGQALAVSVIASDISSLTSKAREARTSISTMPSRALDGRTGIYYTPQPIGASGEVAFVYPGSGNHFLGMGYGMALEWPHVLRTLDSESNHLASNFMPQWHAPYRLSWKNWESEAGSAVVADQHRMIFGQVTHGVLVTDVLRTLGVHPTAALGYSLGESTSLFSLRAWRDRDEMFRRMLVSPLFVNELAGRCESARKLYGVSADAGFEWKVALVNRSSVEVNKALADSASRVSLLIVNAPDECVIGGEQRDVDLFVSDLGAQSWRIEGVSTVHCAVVDGVEKAYRDLHVHVTTPPEGIRFYSGNKGAAYKLDAQTAADSIIAHATRGFDFPKLVRQAYEDGVRVFVEIGPQTSCTRAISKILADRPHVAVGASVRGQDDRTSILRLLARLVTERVPVDLAALYGGESKAVGHQATAARSAATIIVPIELGAVKAVTAPVTSSVTVPVSGPVTGYPLTVTVQVPAPVSAAPVSNLSTYPQSSGLLAMAAATADAHGAFLSTAARSTELLAQNLSFQARVQHAIKTGDWIAPPVVSQYDEPVSAAAVVTPPFMDRSQCLEFATGTIAKVLGQAFSDIDKFPTRVRLPAEPLMLCDRVVSVSGVPQSLKGGGCITEHDVKPGAWYLDGDRMPVCITVEAGQADLFLSAYLGIDRETRGERRYRLLDAKIAFHRALPRPGETVRYEIEIDRFIKQGSTYLFFFRFEGFIGTTPLLTMSEGCAGFFSQAQLEDSQGVVLTADDRAPKAGVRPADWKTSVPLANTTFDESKLTALRAGNLAEAFGPAFGALGMRAPMTLPSGRMKLIDRVVELDPNGGRFGLGRIRGEADIHPDDWFLTCHFIDDMVMPGTLMYECCLHTLRVYLLRMGWIGEQGSVAYEPIPEVQSKLVCRGQVLTTTRVAAYEIDIKEIGFNPLPYAIADAMMYADGKRIVRMTDMSVQLTGLSREQIDALWSTAKPATVAGDKKPAVFDTDRITAFAIGKPSDAFGQLYLPFDKDRKIARLPGPPFQFMDRVTDVSGAAPWALKNGAWIEAQYDVPPDAWYFNANRQSSMPFSILLEAALQPCGWLAGYLGSALRSTSDLSFRNLGGRAVQHEELFTDAGTLTTRVKLTTFSEAGGMIIQKYDLSLSRQGRVVYEGDTQFGFFSKEALAQQVGVRGARERCYAPSPAELARAKHIALPGEEPSTPEGATKLLHGMGPHAMLPARVYRMVTDATLLSDGGPHGLGFVRGETVVDPRTWFFKAHFYQDPVWPGSLGLESFLQLLKVYALDRWPELAATHRFEPIVIGAPHSWAYRGQVVPTNKRVTVEASITKAEEKAGTALVLANGFLAVDGIIIYEMTDFGLRLVPLGRG